MSKGTLCILWALALLCPALVAQTVNAADSGIHEVPLVDDIRANAVVVRGQTAPLQSRSLAVFQQVRR